VDIIVLAVMLIVAVLCALVVTGTATARVDARAGRKPVADAGGRKTG